MHLILLWVFAEVCSHLRCLVDGCSSVMLFFRYFALICHHQHHYYVVQKQSHSLDFLISSQLLHLESDSCCYSLTGSALPCSHWSLKCACSGMIGHRFDSQWFGLRRRRLCHLHFLHRLNAAESCSSSWHRSTRVALSAIAWFLRAFRSTLWRGAVIFLSLGTGSRADPWPIYSALRAHDLSFSRNTFIV